MDKRIKILLAGLLIVGSVAWAADTGTVTSIKAVTQTATKTYTTHVVSWSCDENGDAELSNHIKEVGTLYRIVTDPGDGASSPTANYDFTLLDSNGLDILETVGINRSASVNEVAFPVQGSSDNSPVNLGNLTPKIANAGTTRTGVVYLYFQESKD